MKKMTDEGIETGIHYKPINLMKYYKNKEKQKTAEYVWQELVSIPMHPNLTSENIDCIIENVNKHVK